MTRAEEMLSDINSGIDEWKLRQEEILAIITDHLDGESKIRPNTRQLELSLEYVTLEMMIRKMNIRTSKLENIINKNAS
jgi:hypothetical protein